MKHDGGDVAIAGAGIIGLSIAFELAGRGASVRVFDTGLPGMCASWAAAGMLAPLTESIANASLRTLCEQSLALYPDYVDALRAAGGVDASLDLGGILRVAFAEEDEERLRAAPGTWLDREAALVAEPALGNAARGALLCAGEGHVDNRRLSRALEAACRARGVRVEGQVLDVRVECDARRAVGLRFHGGFVPAGCVINAAGAWAGQLAGVPEPSRVPIRAVKGQMLSLAIPDKLVRRPVWLPETYVVPRRDGRLLVGATSEERGFDTRVTARGIQTLLARTLQYMPSLEDFTISETWAGLRPAAPDDLPILGRTPTEGYFVAAGHYRNGVLLAPATARLLADAIEGRGGENAFELARFGTEAAGMRRNVPSPR